MFKSFIDSYVSEWKRQGILATDFDSKLNTSTDNSFTLDLNYIKCSELIGSSTTGGSGGHF